MLNWYLTWARRLSLFALGLIFFPLAIFLTIASLLDHAAIRTGVRGPYPIPPFAELQSASGFLTQPVELSGGKGYVAVGVVVSPDFDVTGFNCDPINANLACVYTTPAYNSPRIGKTVSIKYFNLPNLVHTDYDIRIPTNQGDVWRHVPRRPVAIVMEADIKDGNTAERLVSYDDSVARLKQDEAQFHLPFGMLAIAAAILLLPGMIYRLATGRAVNTLPTVAGAKRVNFPAGSGA